MGAAIDLTGQRFGRLLALEQAGRCSDGQILWKCVCDCGVIKNVRSKSLRQQVTRSCGCLNHEAIVERNRILKALPVSESSKRGLQARYKREAAKRNRDWGLSLVEFESLIQRPCHYCGATAAQKYISNRKSKGSYTYNGIDRLDNNEGYTFHNCVPCCGKCNWWKRDLTVDEFYQHAHQILNYSARAKAVAVGGR